MSLVTELDTFFSDHRQCGELGIDGPVVWIDCAGTDDTSSGGWYAVRAEGDLDAFYLEDQGCDDQRG